MKKSLFAYIIHVKDSPSPCVNDNSVHDNVSTQVNVNDDDLNHLHLKEFWHKYNSCFANKIHNKLPPIRGDDDHRIDLIPGSAPPNMLIYQAQWVTRWDDGSTTPTTPTLASVIDRIQ